jgi:two-component system CheB/CheR fusion protein
MTEERSRPARTGDGVAMDPPSADWQAANGDGPDTADDDGLDAEPADQVSTDGATDPKFYILLERLHAEHNFDFRQYKEISLLRRLRRRLSQLHLDSVEKYLDVLSRDPNEHRELLNVLLINVTRFFRDRDAWDVLRERVLPAIVTEAAASHCIRVWSVGCSSGEEPYTAAILIAEALRGRPGGDLDVRIYATDIDDAALATARAGLYPREQIKDVPDEFRERYFQPEGQMYRVRRDVRRWCIFGHHDLTQDVPLSRIDLVICRNVLIYFNSALQDRILPRFQYAVRPNGYLFLGRAESMLGRSQGFQPMDSKWRIFRCAGPTRAEVPPGPLVAIDSPPRAPAQGHEERAENHTVTLRIRGIVEGLQTAIMVIDPADTVVTWNPAAEVLFDIPAESAIHRKFRDLDISYRIDGLRSRIEEVKSTQGRVRMNDITFPRRSGETAHVGITIAPLHDERGRLSGVLVCADDMTEHRRLREEIEHVAEQSETANEELQSTNEELETTNEELQSTNEELETINEELQSTNEELETTVEELQSINAELGTLNTELERRTGELNQLDRYHKNILDTLEAAVVVLDAALVVTAWNQGATEMWGMKSSDTIGRPFLTLPIGDVVRKAREPMHAVLDDRGRREVLDVVYLLPGGDERRATLRLRPLVGSNDDLAGLVAVATPDEPAGHQQR